MGMKIVHLHSDPKFVSDSRVLMGGRGMKHVLALLGSSGAAGGGQACDGEVREFSPAELPRLVELCSEADAVVVYCLDPQSSALVEQLPDPVCVIWRFFGTELYKRMPDEVLSPSTLRALEDQGSSTIGSKLKNLIRALLPVGRRVADDFGWLDRAIARSDYFLGLSADEHAHLKKRWPEIPPFLQIPLSQYVERAASLGVKRRVVIVGNNRNLYNNHLDVLESLASAEGRRGYEFVMPFNYGKWDSYSRAVLKKARGIPEVTTIDEFLPVDQYLAVLREASAFVMNGYRQMAMFNVFQALNHGVKLYLSEKNLVLWWLREEGFRVFTVEEFFEDLTMGDVGLSQEDFEQNMECLERFAEKYSREAFLQQFEEALVRHRRRTSSSMSDR